MENKAWKDRGQNARESQKQEMEVSKAIKTYSDDTEITIYLKLEI